MLTRKHPDSVLPAVGYMAALALVVGAASFVEGAKARTCPAVLEDGRRLVSFQLSGGVCKYAPPPFRMILSPEEHRRAASAMERMEKVRKNELQAQVTSRDR